MLQLCLSSRKYRWRRRGLAGHWIRLGVGYRGKNNEWARDPARNVVQARISVDKEPCYGIGIGGDRVWVLNCQGKTLTRINPKN